MTFSEFNATICTAGNAVPVEDMGAGGKFEGPNTGTTVGSNGVGAFVGAAVDIRVGASVSTPKMLRQFM
jgi:hypothetical protein